ncbi:MAG: SpoIIIAH-like family protein [Paenibacillus sp.]|jgi:stage III sporulation protein AH|nr:SpoIIIAH-like family protein [Paenibacillus sp.]
MNAKRQTVWLVSMLSLMVVLSAYYLFTEDVNEVEVANNQILGNEIKVDTVTKDAGQETKSQPTSAGVTGTNSSTGAATTDATKKTDAEVLKQVANTAMTGSDYFKTAQMKRQEELGILVEKWMTVSLDSKKTTEEVQKALTELDMIQDQEARVASVEDLLGKDFSNALVLQEGSKWKVVVQAAKLEKSQGVSIVDLVMKELNVGADKISIQYVQ